MMEAKKLTSSDMDNVRNLLLGQNNKLIKQTVEQDARELVTKVISEAILDRQKRDNSLTTAMTPLIESAVEKSIESNKSKFVSYLYPIVGSLVRKSVSVFFNGFLEKLNYLIEYSLTFKGIKWRFDAWRKGIPFTHYILKQTFNYRVEQVFFIHRETGALLSNACSDNSQFNDPNLVSAMLTAINDFVADSFNADSNDHLDTVKTKDLTLVIEAGPKALLVAAVSGNMPNDIKALLNQTSEQLHALFITPLTEFDGDDSEFASAEPLLRECLISELSPQGKKQGKKTKLAWLALGAACLPLIYIMTIHWQTTQKVDQLNNLTWPAGIAIQHITQTGIEAIEVNYLADPLAQDLKVWLPQQGIAEDALIFSAHNFVSTDKEIVRQRAISVLKQLGVSDSITIEVQGDVLILSGQASYAWPLNYTQPLMNIIGISSIDSTKVSFPTITADPTMVNQQLLEHIQSELRRYTIDFAIDSSLLTPIAETKLSELAEKLILATRIASQLKVPFGVILSGFSDATGNSTQNMVLSQLRADKVKSYLEQQGVENQVLFAVGVGELKLSGFESDGRKVVFSPMQLNINLTPNSPVKPRSKDEPSLSSNTKELP